MSADALPHAIRRLAEGRNLTADECSAAFDILMQGKAAPSQIAALLMGLRIKGENSDEVSGAAAALRRAMLPLDCDDPSSLVDTCVTGGGSIQTFNISTAAALLTAGAGVRVAKHGNRSFTSRSGSADVLEALGVAVDVTPEVMARGLRSAGIVFMFAPVMHPAMRHVGPVRRELGIATIMNILGPLANPAGAKRQVVGVAEPARLALIANALAALGSEHALVVHGAPGMDELSPLGTTTVFEVLRGKVTTWSINPEELGLSPGEMRATDLAGGSPEENALVIEGVLQGRGAPAAEAAVLLNAAAAIYVSGRAPSIEVAFQQAQSALLAGAGTAALSRLRAAQKKNQ